MVIQVSDQWVTYKCDEFVRHRSFDHGDDLDETVLVILVMCSKHEMCFAYMYLQPPGGHERHKFVVSTSASRSYAAHMHQKFMIMLAWALMVDQLAQISFSRQRDLNNECSLWCCRWCARTWRLTHELINWVRASNDFGDVHRMKSRDMHVHATLRRAPSGVGELEGDGTRCVAESDNRKWLCHDSKVVSDTGATWSLWLKIQNCVSKFKWKLRSVEFALSTSVMCLSDFSFSMDTSFDFRLQLLSRVSMIGNALNHAHRCMLTYM